MTGREGGRKRVTKERQRGGKQRGDVKQEICGYSGRMNVSISHGPHPLTID